MKADAVSLRMDFPFTSERRRGFSQPSHPPLPRRHGAVYPFAAFVLASCLLMAPEAPALPPVPPRNAAREAAVTAPLREIAPDAVPDFVAGTAAMDARDYHTAVAAYRRVAEKAPGFDAVWRRLGGCLMSMGETTEALALHERALSIRRTPENLASLAQSLASRTPAWQPSSDVLRRALSLITEATAQAPTEADYVLLKATIELQLNDYAAFQSTAATLSQLAPHLAPAHYYAAIAAAMNEQWNRAEREIREAGRLGLPDSTVNNFLASGIGVRARARRWSAGLAVAAGLLALGLVLRYSLRKRRSRVTLRTLERDGPHPRPASD